MTATQTRSRKSAPRKGRKTAADIEARRAKVAALSARLEAFEGDDANAGLIAAALASFDGYSDRNAMLIAMQCPTATDVSGFRQWIDRGRRVAAGEHGIQILAPAGSREVQDENKAGQPEGEVRTRKFFRIAYVFDIAQTISQAEFDAIQAARAAAEVEDDSDYELVA